MEKVRVKEKRKREFLRKEGTHFLRETRELVSYSEKREKVLK